jgi:hypothetical protein
MSNVLLLGGPKHGKRIVFRAHRISFPVYRGAALYRTEQEFLTASSPYQEVTYEQRRIGFGGSRVTVGVPTDYSEDAAMRALADYIEGVPRYLWED